MDRDACRGGFRTRPYDQVDKLMAPHRGREVAHGRDTCRGGFQTRPYDQADKLTEGANHRAGRPGWRSLK
jgi:hypothetical protein